MFFFFFDFIVQARQDKSVISNDAYSPSSSLVHENPPFIPGFFVLKFEINETIVVKVPRTVRVGMCLPSSCSLDDVEQLALLSEKALENRQVDVISVRSPTQNPYDYWNDRTFIILV